MNTNTATVLRATRKNRKGIPSTLRRRILGTSIAALVACGLTLKNADAAVVTFSYTGPAVAIPDAADLSGTNPGAAVSAPLTVSGTTGTISNIIFRFDGTPSTTVGSTTVGLDHSFVSDLRISLISPLSTSVLLINEAGGSGNNFAQTVLDDTAATGIQSVTSSNAPFTGTFRPNAPLSGFNGQSANGIWNLQVQDFFNFDTGNIRLWSLVITTVDPATHWLGGTDGKWTGNVNNWASDSTGTATPATPTSTDDITFSATGAAHQSTTLEQNFTIHSLTISDSAAVTIDSGTGGPFTLTLSGNATTGLDVQAGAGLVTIGANLTLSGLSDTITVNNTAGAVINGALGGANGLNKLGSGTLTLAGTNTYTGNTTVDGGGLTITGSVGNGTSTDTLTVGNNNGGTNLTVSGGGTLTNGKTVVGATAGSTGNTLNVTGAGSLWQSSVTFYLGFSGGGNTLTIDSHGAVTVSNGTGLNVDTVLGFNPGADNNRLVVNGPGGSFTNNATLYVGLSSNGNELDILNGGTVTSKNVRIGGGTGSTGPADGNSAVVDGPTSLWNVSGTLRVGSSGTNSTLILSNAGILSVAGNSFLGYDATSSGNNVLITGPGSRWNANALFIGRDGTDNTVIVANGGILAANSITLGLNAGSSGKLQIGTGGPAGTVQVSSVTSGLGTGAVEFNHEQPSYTFVPVIAGSTSVSHKGTGTTTLATANTYTGGTTIYSGTLAAGNVKALGNGNLTIMGGTLRTTGGPLAVDIGAGNILFGGGTYLATVGGTTPGVTHDQLKTTGSANIGGGTLALVQLNSFHLSPGDKVVLLSAIGGVAGGSANGTAVPGSNVTGLAAFSTSLLIVPVVNLYTNSVVLEAMQGSFGALAGTLGFTPNQSAVAGALDSVVAKIGSKTGLIKELDYLDTLPSSVLAANLNLLSPADLTSIFHLAKSLANVQTANVQRRLEEIRGTDVAVVASTGGLRTGGGSQGPKGTRGKSIAPAPDERWGTWFSGSGEFTRVGSTTNAAGFSLDSGGVTGGVDYRFTEHFAAGISLGYMNTTADLSNGGKIDADGGRVGAYATYFDRGLHLDAAVSGGPNSYRTRRTTPNNTAATGGPEGTEVNLLFAAGYDWKWKGITLGPVASFQYTNVQLNGFTERGTFAPLSIAAKNADSARSALGFHATFDAKVGRVIIRPEVRAAWQHEFGDTSYSLTSTFATLGGSAFTVAGPETGRDSLLVGAGFSVLWNERFSTYFFYDGELLRTNYSSNNVSVGFRLRF